MKGQGLIFKSVFATRLNGQAFAGTGQANLRLYIKQEGEIRLKAPVARAVTVARSAVARPPALP